jgi:AraC-like DNA-binding protein
MTSDVRDPLGDVLALLRPEAAVAAELRAHGRWSLAFDGYPGVKFGVVVQGECRIGIRGRAAKTLRAGDVFLLGGAPPYVMDVMASDMETPSRNANDLLRGTKKRVARLGSVREKPVMHIVGGRFALDPANAHLLVEALPEFVRIPADEASSLRDVTRLLIDEVRAEESGRLRALDQLAQLVLTYALRWLDSEGKSPARAGWLRALADSRIGAALRHIHSSVETGTSLADLARVAGMSRTAFTARFKELVGQPPRAYAIQWRISLAKDALRTTDRAIGELAFKLGYESESAFSMAFRREVGCSPRAYRRESSGNAYARGQRVSGTTCPTDPRAPGSPILFPSLYKSSEVGVFGQGQDDFLEGVFLLGVIEWLERGRLASRVSGRRGPRRRSHGLNRPYSGILDTAQSILSWAGSHVFV